VSQRLIITLISHIRKDRINLEREGKKSKGGKAGIKVSRNGCQSPSIPTFSAKETFSPSQPKHQHRCSITMLLRTVCIAVSHAATNDESATLGCESSTITALATQ
jgi:hypothetical protein